MPMTRFGQTLTILFGASLGVAACTDSIDTSNTPTDPSQSGSTAGSDTNTFDHDNNGISVWDLIDRLTKAGAVKRVPDADDRRKVILVVTSELRTGRTSVYFDAFQAALKRMYRRYSDYDIRVIDRFSREMSALLQEETARLRSVNSRKFKRPRAPR